MELLHPTETPPTGCILMLNLVALPAALAVWKGWEMFNEASASGNTLAALGSLGLAAVGVAIDIATVAMDLKAANL